jgi:probable metal-binding protein
MNTIHAHQVLNLIGKQATPLTVGQLQALVTDTFGEHLRFVNCHDDYFTFEQMIAFMLERQKIVLRNGTITLNKSNICEH